MLENLVNFAVVIIIQLLFFVVHAVAVRESHNIHRYLMRGMLLGLPFGIAFDLLVGKGFGMYSYEIGYIWWFLAINALFSWGFMIANVFLLQHHSWWHMYLWSTGLAIVYEFTNFLFPVWEWAFHPNPVVEFIALIFLLYASLTVALMAAMRLAYRFHFKLLPF